ncbi:ABC transporter ATP-binding protein [Oceanicella sp. SM1341]|uniref:ABC transporter ATP-binding protein n=1 Tax=Oceanicella sp. SM1341 TaxID=1548889 RepID=UPI000E50CCEE|nr:ABC transporter ATP-binding protein [Oceanicella sp. SM1341]
MTPKLELRGVAKAFGEKGSPTRVTAVRDLSFTVAAGELVAVVGPSGCGKSTILNMVSGLYGPSEGAVLIDGAEVKGPRSEVGFMLQKDLLLPWRTVIENVEFGLETRKLPKAERRRIARAELRRIRLEEFADSYPYQLSGGMRQRVALARTLAISPELVLLDEPFSALDAQTKLVLQKSFSRTLSESGLSCLLITHDLQEAVIMSDRVVVLSGRPGTVVDTFAVDLPHRDDPLARSTLPATQAYVKRLFDTLHIAEGAA